MFDITTLAATDTSTVELVGGDDAPLFDEKGKRLSITVYGPGSKVYQRAQARQQNQLMDKIKKRGKMDQTAEEKLAEQADFLAAHGLDALVAAGAARWRAEGIGGGLEAIAGRSRVHEADALTDPTGLGAFRVLEWLA